MTSWMWLFTGLVLLMIELATPGGFYFLFFGIGAIAVGLLSSVDVISQAWVEWLMFSVISIVALLVLRRPMLKKFHSKLPVAEVDNLVGETAIALDMIAGEGFGKVELRGAAWNARNTGSEAIPKGQRCKVDRVEGLLLWVRTQ